MISVVIETFNAGETLSATLTALVPAAVSNLVREVVIADAGSTDETLEIAEDAGATVVKGKVAAGAGAAKGPWLLFLHPASRLGAEWEAAARDHLEHHATEAGYFRLALDDHRAGARLKEAWAGLQTTLAGGPSPAHGLLVSKRLYDEVGGEVGLARGLKGRLRPLAARVFAGS